MLAWSRTVFCWGRELHGRHQSEALMGHQWGPMGAGAGTGPWMSQQQCWDQQMWFMALRHHQAWGWRLGVLPSCRVEGCWTPLMPSAFKEQGMNHQRGILQIYQDGNILVSWVLVCLSEYFVINALYLLPLFPVVLIRNILVYMWEWKASTSGDFEGGIPKNTYQVRFLGKRTSVLGAGFPWPTSLHLERSW